MIFVHVFHKRDRSPAAQPVAGKGVHCLRFEDEAHASRALGPYLKARRGLSAVRVVPEGPLIKVGDVQTYASFEKDVKTFGRGDSIAGVRPRRRHWSGLRGDEAGLPALVMERMGFAGVEALNGANTLLQGSVIWSGSFESSRL